MREDENSLDLPEPLQSALAAWARAEGLPLRRLIERLLSGAVQERRVAARAELAAARRSLEGATAMLAKLLEKGPGTFLVPDDFAEGEPARDETLRLVSLVAGEAEVAGEADDGARSGASGDAVAAVDLRAVRAALEQAVARYQTVADILPALDLAGMAAPTPETPSPGWTHGPASLPQSEALGRAIPVSTAEGEPESAEEPRFRPLTGAQEAHGEYERRPPRRIGRHLFGGRDNE